MGNKKKGGKDAVCEEMNSRPRAFNEHPYKYKQMLAEGLSPGRFFAIMRWVMHMENELPNRKPTRLKNFDYNSSGAYFLTICTENRRRILSRIVGGDIRMCRGLYQHSNAFAIKNMAKTFGKDISTTISFETAKTMKNTKNTSTKIQCAGATMSCTQKNKVWASPDAFVAKEGNCCEIEDIRFFDGYTRSEWSCFVGTSSMLLWSNEIPFFSYWQANQRYFFSLHY